MRGCTDDSMPHSIRFCSDRHPRSLPTNSRGEEHLPRQPQTRNNTHEQQRLLLRYGISTTRIRPGPCFHRLPGGDRRVQELTLISLRTRWRGATTVCSVPRSSGMSVDEKVPERNFFVSSQNSFPYPPPGSWRSARRIQWCEETHLANLPT